MAKSQDPPLIITTLILVFLLLLLIIGGTDALDHFMQLSFGWRVFIVCLVLLPIGLCLGIFFPAGLHLIGKNHPEAVAWAWGINCGFSVLGSILAVILAQFHGFNAILMLATVAYLIGLLAFQRLEQSL